MKACLMCCWKERLWGGNPLIASNIPGCKEIIEEGYNGYLFELKSVESMEEKLIQFIELE